MESTATVSNIRYGDVFEFQVDGRYYYFQSIYWSVKVHTYRVVKLFFNGVSERPSDMESYLSKTESDYYSYNFYDDINIYRENFDDVFSYVGCYPSEYEKWKNEAPPFRIESWPIDDFQSCQEKPWNFNRDQFTRYRIDEIRRLREEWIAKPHATSEYYPLWKILFGCGEIFFHSLPAAQMLDVPIYTDSLHDEIRFYTNRGLTPRKYFLKLSTEIGSERLETQVVAAKIASANDGKLNDEEVELARAFERTQTQNVPLSEGETVLSKRFAVDPTNENFRKEFSFGDVFEIHKGRNYYYFQTIRPINFYERVGRISRPEPYFLIKLLYARFNKRPTDLIEIFNSSPSQILVSRVRYSDEIEHVGNFDVSSEWRDADPRFFLFFDPTFLGWNICPNEHVVMIRADRPVWGSYFYDTLYTGCSFPAKYRNYPILCPVGYDRIYQRNEQFSEKAINAVDYYLKNAKFKIDEVWSSKRILAWAQRAQRGLRPDFSGELPEFVAYKFTATDLRKRAKKLVGTQRRRKQFTSETIAKFEAILTEFVDNIVDKKDDKKNIQKHAKAAIRKLNRMNDKLDQELIETEERDELFQFFFDSGSYVGIDIGKLIEDAREW